MIQGELRQQQIRSSAKDLPGFSQSGHNAHVLAALGGRACWLSTGGRPPPPVAGVSEGGSELQHRVPHAPAPLRAAAPPRLCRMQEWPALQRAAEAAGWQSVARRPQC